MAGVLALVSSGSAKIVHLGWEQAGDASFIGFVIGPLEFLNFFNGIYPSQALAIHGGSSSQCAKMQTFHRQAYTLNFFG